MLASLHDRPWTVIIIARTAHQLGVPEVVSGIPVKSKLTDYAMDGADAFSKWNGHIMS